MCGIIGYVGPQESVPILLEGLRRMEYRGYDSAGLAVLNGEGIKVEKAAGKIAILEKMIDSSHPKGRLGIAHTRWATHGVPNTINAHPHVDCKGRIAVVHNGIIENYSTLKTKLQQEGHKFTTDTDTEVIAHLIEKFYDGNLEKAVAAAVRLLTGTYGLAVIATDDPTKIVGARHGSPLVVGIADSEYILASDVSAIIRHTNQVVYLDDEEMVILTPGGIHTTTIREEEVSKKIETVDWDLEMIEKAGFPHFMLKEIFEQPQSIRNTLRGRLLPEEGMARLGGLNMSAAELRALQRVVITACGTSWHAGLIGEYLIEELARIPVEVEYASEFRYRNPILEPGTLVLAISQSGETADTLAAMREAKRKGARVLGVCNVVGSTIARESDGGVYIHAGPEIGVASTKAFTSQLVALHILALYLAQVRGTIDEKESREHIEALTQLPLLIEEALKCEGQIEEIAKRYPSMTVTGQRRVQTRMQNWAKLTPPEEAYGYEGYNRRKS
jgi:glucosamine--fructose-6-phosphate aminotransferase (isomerizing)